MEVLSRLGAKVWGSNGSCIGRSGVQNVAHVGDKTHTSGYSIHDIKPVPLLGRK